MENLTLSGIVLAHHFIAPPGWVSDEYAFARQHHGIVYVLSGAAAKRCWCGPGTACMSRAVRSMSPGAAARRALYT